MPIHFNDLDVVSAATGLKSALIVPCNMCPAATVAVREKKPFMEFFRSFMKSLPFEQYIKEFGNLAKENNTVIIPSTLSDVAGMVGAATSLIKTTAKS